MNEVKFYEFNTHEYYGLVGAFNVDQAFEIYHNDIAGESVEQIQAEGLPDEITKELAFSKFKESSIKYGDLDETLIVNQFADGFGSLLVDGSLL